jgi:hypothetical protein
MTLKFARYWNRDYDSNDSEAIIKFNGTVFRYPEARAILRQAVSHQNGAGLRTVIDQHEARVVRGPHKTPTGDTRLHMSVHCPMMNAIYHVYVSPKGNVSGVEQENVSGVSPKTGHVQDDRDAPTIANVAEL